MIIEATIMVLIICGLLLYVAKRNLTPIDPFIEDWMEVADTAWDYRDDLNKRGMLFECWYCNATILADGEAEDFSVSEPEIHCEECTSAATRNLCG